MPQTTLQNGSVLRSIEYRVSELDENGEIIDVNGYETRDEATKYARILVDLNGSIAAVVERHTQYWPAHRVKEADIYELVFTLGDQSALTAGGWQK